MTATTSVTLPTGALPPIPGGYELPFHYGTLTNIGVDFLVEPGKARAVLEAALKADGVEERLCAAVFGGKACLSFNYQLYYAQFARGAAVVQEIELNVVVFPTAEAAGTPALTYQQYATGQDTTGRLGFYRVLVACDSDLAIDAGRTMFGEPKFRADLTATLPSPNGTAVNKGTTKDPQWETVWCDTWTAACGKAGAKRPDGSLEPAGTYVSFTADLRGLTPRSGTVGFTEYGTRRTGNGTRPIAAPLTVYAPYDWYDLAGRTGTVTVTPGTDTAVYAKVRDFVDAVKEVPAAGAWVHRTPPAAVQGRPYWVGG